MHRSEIIRFLILRTIGNFLLLFSIYGVIATFGPSLLYELQFRVAQARGINFAVEDPVDTRTAPRERRSNDYDGPGFGAILAGDRRQTLIPADSAFSITIPKIGATAKVFPNVDPGNEAEFKDVLQQGVAHAKGTVFPGIVGNTYLFAHSTDNWWNVGRYNAIFYLLKDLKPGDEVVVFFEDRRYNYVVDHTLIADPSEVSFLVNSQTSGKEQLILQTCWPPGTTWKRLFVVAVPKGEVRKNN